MNCDERILTTEGIESFLGELRGQERARATVEKYGHTLRGLLAWHKGRRLDKEGLILWKEEISGRCSASTVNVMIAAVNSYLTFRERPELRIRPLKIQRQLFCSAQKELTRAEYQRLVCAARSEKKERLTLVIQTLGGTGIRVSELRYITAEAVRTGKAEVNCKGKRRAVFLPGSLQKLLREYLRKEKRKSGAVFVTRSGKPLDRSNIWREMKALCIRAGVEPGKVFPHNLRHLFARTYYTLEKDLSRLADILGHSSVSTTRIYTAESGKTHLRQLNRMGLVETT